MGAEPSLDGAARFRYLEQAFAEVADAASGVQRAKVAELRQLDAALGEQLAQLLTAAGSEKAGQMDVPKFDPELVPTPSKPESRLGQNVGPFQLDAVLGSGGMGEVYLASRRDDFAQTVAIKLLRGAMSDGIFAQRFLQERETLGRLNHPHIAGLIDGGATKEGSPWLAMEHVAGVNLVDYCDQEKLSTQGTIKLLLEVAEAVQFAHQQLIVHRDIKPGNIMVREDGHPVLLDFGIAKLLEESPAQAAPQAQMYTPEYASPEQMRGENVGTTSDVYSLGVVLDRVLGRSDQARSTDLSAIIDRCRKEDPHRRYATVQALIDDLRRWQKGLPVQAQPNTWWYRTRRFLQRNRVAMTLATMIAIVGIGGFSAWFQQSQLAARKGLTASRVSEFLLEFFSQPDPWAQGLAEMNLEDFFASNLSTLFESLQDEPEVERDLAAALGLVLRNLGDYERAIPLLIRARDAVELEATDDPLALAGIYFELGVAYYRAGQLPEAEDQLQQSMHIRQAELGDSAEEIASVLNTLGLVHHTMGDLTQAKIEYSEALQMRQRLHGATGLPLASTLNNLGALALNQGEMKDAIGYFQRARKIHQAAYLEKGHPDLATTLNNLGMAYQFNSELDQAEQLFQESLAMRRRVLPPDHPHLAGSLNNLGLIEDERGNTAEAAKLFADALQLAKSKASADHPLLRQIQENLEDVNRE